MPRSGGIYSLIASYFAVDNTVIDTDQHNPVLEDIAQALTDSLPRDGTAAMTGNLNMGNKKVTSLAAATLGSDAARFDQVPFRSLAFAADKLPYATGPTTFNLADFTPFARTLLDDPTAAAARATLGAMKGNGTETTDWNSAINDGHYWADGTATNGPTANAHTGEVIRRDDNNVIQLVWARASDRMYFRRSTAGVWASWVEVVSAGNLATLTPFTKSYGSAEFTVVAGGLTTLTHGLAAVPRLITVEARCTTASDGYAVNDVIEIAPGASDPAGSVEGLSCKKNSTSIFLRCGTGGPAVYINDDTGAAAVLSAANWAFTVRAYA